MESDRVTLLASVGLAVRATSPALLHAIRGCLHDVTMLAALLQPPAAALSDDLSPAAKTAQRLRAINAQLDLLERNVALLDAMTEVPRRNGEAVCATAAVLPDVVRLLHDEAARHRVRLEHDLDSLPPHLQADERALQKALLTCGAWTAQHVGERATMLFRGREEAGEALFDFETTDASAKLGDGNATRDDIALLAALAEAAGGRLLSAPRLRLAFARASGRSAVPE